MRCKHVKAGREIWDFAYPAAVPLAQKRSQQLTPQIIGPDEVGDVQ
jgi:hypothetical protein